MYAKVEGPPEDWMKYRVFLYGSELERCTEANEEEGWAECFVTNEEGNLQVDGDEIMRGRIDGPVELRKVYS